MGWFINALLILIIFHNLEENKFYIIYEENLNYFQRKKQIF
ncbi:hypothetical protein ES706_05649 [subsurface metagenome]